MNDFPAGFIKNEGFDPAEDYIGPFYHRSDSSGYLYAFRADQRHCNTNGIVHGGILMTFADFALCMEATDHYDSESCVTISFNSEFVAAVQQGDLVQCRAEVVRKTGSMVFVRGDVFTDTGIAMSFSAVVKRLFDRAD